MAANIKALRLYQCRSSLTLYTSSAVPQACDELRDAVLNVIRENAWKSSKDSALAFTYVSNTCVCRQASDIKYVVMFNSPVMLTASQLGEYAEYVIRIAKTVAETGVVGIASVSPDLIFEYIGIESFLSPRLSAETSLS